MEQSSSMTLKGTFSVSAVVDIPNAAEISTLTTDLQTALPDYAVTLLPASATAAPVTFARFTLELADHAGIIKNFSEHVALMGLSISLLQTEQTIAPFGGTLLFSAAGTLASEGPANMDVVMSKMQQLEQEYGISVQIEELSSA